MPAEPGWHPDQPTARLSRRHVAADAEDETQDTDGYGSRRAGGRHGRSDTTETPVLGQIPEPAPGGEPASWSMLAPEPFRPESTVILPARPDQPDADQPRRRARHAHPDAEQPTGAPRFAQPTAAPRFAVPTPDDDHEPPRFEVPVPLAGLPQRLTPDAGEQLFVASPAPGHGEEQLFTPAAEVDEHLFRPSTPAPGNRFDPAERLAQLQAAARDEQPRHPAVPEPPGRRHWWPAPDERQAADVRDPAVRRSRHADPSADAAPAPDEPQVAEPFAAARRFAAERALPVAGTRPDAEWHGVGRPEPTAGAAPGGWASDAIGGRPETPPGLPDARPGAGWLEARQDPAGGRIEAYPGGGWAAEPAAGRPDAQPGGGWAAGPTEPGPTQPGPTPPGPTQPGQAVGARPNHRATQPSGAPPGHGAERSAPGHARSGPGHGAEQPDQGGARVEPAAGGRRAARQAADESTEDRTAENPVLGRGAQRPAKLDAETVLAAVRDVPGVRAADLRTDAGGGRTLRLDVAEGMDTDEITAAAGHALRDRLGVDARLAVAAGAGYELDPVDIDPAEVEHRPVSGGAVDTPRPSGDRRAIIERIQVATAGAECAVEVCLTADGVRAVGRAGGPALDPYLLRVAALATADAVSVLAGGRARCAVEHVDIVTAGPCRVVVVVLVLVADERAERLVGSAVASGDVRQATVRATMSAVNRRLGPLLDAVLAS
ncbi:MAG TPA: hypothetical protein VGN37_23115 [Actinocatenispora sp.]